MIPQPFLEFNTLPQAQTLFFAEDSGKLGLNREERVIMKRMVIPLLVLLVPAVSAVLNAGLKDDIRISLEEKQIQDLSSEGLTLAFYLNLENSSNKTYYLSGYAYRFVVNEREYLRLQVPLEGGPRIDPRKKTMISLPVRITYDLLYRSVGDLSGEKMVGCYLMGELAFSDGRRSRGSLPVAFNGEFPIYRRPEIVLEALRANAVTIGGADLLLETGLTNLNGFDFTVTSWVYTLKFGGHEILSDRRNRGVPLPAGGKIPLNIPVLINYFEVGSAVRGLLQQETVRCRLTGELELRTPWGRLTLPYDVEAQVPLVKGG
jgi:hypothetical protein